MFDDERPLGGVAESAYETLLAAIDAGEGIPTEEAHARLLEDDFPEEDAEFAIQRLINRGYLYRVEGNLYVTDYHLGEDSSENDVDS
jgi:hypothetical protein